MQWTASGTQLARRNVSRQEEQYGEGEEYAPFGRPGAGAPLMSRDGCVDASLRAHPETRFQNHLHREVNNSLVRT